MSTQYSTEDLLSRDGSSFEFSTSQRDETHKQDVVDFDESFLLQLSSNLFQASASNVLTNNDDVSSKLSTISDPSLPDESDDDELMMPLPIQPLVEESENSDDGDCCIPTIVSTSNSSIDSRHSFLTCSSIADSYYSGFPCDLNLFNENYGMDVETSKVVDQQQTKDIFLKQTNNSLTQALVILSESEYKVSNPFEPSPILFDTPPLRTFVPPSYETAASHYTASFSIEQRCSSRCEWTISDFPDELVCSITSFLDVRSLLNVRQTCHRFHIIASRDASGWQAACRRLWNSKVNVCQYAIDAMKRHSESDSVALRAYGLSIQDAANRNEITMEELSFDPVTAASTITTTTLEKIPIWWFRFKETAGPDWTSWDPWWTGGSARQMVFLRDGRVMQLVPLLSQETTTTRASNNENAIVIKLHGNDFVLRNAFYDGNPLLLQGATTTTSTTTNGTASFSQPQQRGIDVRWRFVNQPMDFPARPLGAYIRLTVGGRDVPTYVVRRSPTGNWGFVLESCWGVYSSFELPSRTTTTTTTLTDGQTISDRYETQRESSSSYPAQPSSSLKTRRRTRMRLRRTQNGGRWINVHGIESDSEEEDDDDEKMDSADNTSTKSSLSSLLDDAAMTVTNSCQWREALLYNYGAASLPENDEDSLEFDRVWNTAMSQTQVVFQGESG